MGMFEYEVGLSEARSKEDMKFVAEAYAAGSNQRAAEILSSLKQLSNEGHLNLAWFQVEKIIRETGK
jgi:hypothetical protein